MDFHSPCVRFHSQAADFHSPSFLSAKQFAKHSQHIRYAFFVGDGDVQGRFTSLFIDFHDGVNQLLGSFGRLQRLGQAAEEREALLEQFLGIGWPVWSCPNPFRQQ